MGQRRGGRRMNSKVAQGDGAGLLVRLFCEHLLGTLLDSCIGSTSVLRWIAVLPHPRLYPCQNNSFLGQVLTRLITCSELDAAGARGTCDLESLSLSQAPSFRCGAGEHRCKYVTETCHPSMPSSPIPIAMAFD